MIARLAAVLSLSLFLFAAPACKSAGGSSTVPGVTVPEPEPGKAVVVFYRPKKAKGAGIQFEVREAGGLSLGKLLNGTAIFGQLEPGSHSYSVRTPSLDGTDSITLNVLAGQTIYVEGKILWGWPAGRPQFTLMTEEKAVAALAEL